MFFEFITVPVGLLLLMPLWQVYTRAGLTPALSLLVLIPAIGPFLAIGILALSRWPAMIVRGGR